MLKGLRFICFTIAICLALFTQVSFSQEQEEAKEKVKSPTEAVESTKTEVKKPKKAQIQVKKKKTKSEEEEVEEVGDSSTETEISDITIDNEGIQAIFINSEVHIHGGTIGGEIHKTINEKPTVAEEEDEEGGGGRPRPSGNGAPPEKPQPFDEAIKDATKLEGLFTVYIKEGPKVLIEIRPDQMGPEYLVSGALATGLSVSSIKPGADIGQAIIKFEHIHNKIHVIQQNKRFTVTDEGNEIEAVRKNHSDSLIAAIPYAATNPENEAYLVDVTNFVMMNLFDANQIVRSFGFGIDPSTSYIEDVKAFPKNVIFRNHYSLRTGSLAMGLETAPDPTKVQLETVIDIRPLKLNPDFKPRPYDKRVGYFVEAIYDYGNVTEADNLRRYIAKWDIRKASPEAELSPPVEPIVIHLENTFPDKWKSAVRDGILEWNKAFEKIGIKDAIKVKDQPDDAEWDAADARFNVVHWNTSFDELYSGVAQWVSHPQTGEIFNGGFLLEADQVRAVINLLNHRTPGRFDEFKKIFEREQPTQEKHFGCEFSKGLVEQAVVGLTVQMARNGIEGLSEEEIDEYVKQFLFAVSVHEMGHVLGLRHNFKASTMLPLEEINDKELTAEKSFSASVMDYAPVNIAPPGEEQGYYFEPTIGAYDYFAIEYGYSVIEDATAEVYEEKLDQIAEKGETGDLVYATDEELYAYGGIDPLNNHFDLGRDPIKWGGYMTEIASQCIPLLPNLVQEGEDYHVVRNAFDRLIYYYYSASQYAIHYLGGQHTWRLKKGGDNGLLPLQPVSAAKQREALNFLNNEIFNDKIFQYDNELLNMLRGEREYHWASAWPGEAIDYPLTDTAEAIYDVILSQVYSVRTTRRILDTEQQRDPSANSFTLPEFYEILNNGIWSEVYQASEKGVDSEAEQFISVFRRILQRQQLKLLIRTMLEPPIGMPDDSRTQAWRMLTELRDNIQQLLNNDEVNMDRYSHDHLAESLEKIERALEARLSVRVDFW